VLVEKVADCFAQKYSGHFYLLELIRVRFFAPLKEPAKNGSIPTAGTR
jgi:hypothetical protein